MKVRQGFVSNSSSSSFIVLVKDETMSAEERREKNIAIYREEYGEDFDEVAEDGYINKWLAGYEKEHQYILLKQSVEYGGEDSVTAIVTALLDKLGVATENITFAWDE